MRMTEKPVISNTSPLIGLSGINLLSLYRDIYTEVWIPREVENEFLAINTDLHRSILTNSPWIKTVDLENPNISLEYSGLDAGEAEVIALAKEHDARLVIIDDQLARQEALNVGLQVKGIVGVLLEAKEVELIDTVKPLLFALQENGIYLGNALIEHALRVAGEE